MIRTLLILFTLLSAQLAHADSRLDHANQLQASAEYAGAIQEYKQLLSEYGSSPNLLFDLGMAQLAAGQVGPALVNLQRASVLAPRDTEIRTSLQSAREEAGIAARSARWHQRLTRWLSPREWAFVAGAAVVLASLAIVAFGLWPQRRRRALPLAIAGLVLAALAATSSHLASADLRGGVVIKDGAVARQSPFDRAEALFSLPVGEPVAMERNQGAYSYVETRAGARGWVESSALTRLEGDPST